MGESSCVCGCGWECGWVRGGACVRVGVYWVLDFGLMTCLSQVWSHVLDNSAGWQFGQVPLLAGTRFQVVFEGLSFNGGYTLDDFKVYAGACTSE